MPDDKTYNIMPLFSEDGTIHYTDEVNPVFDQIGSQSPDNRINNDEFLNLTKHHNGSIGITSANYKNYVENRARNQSTWDRIGNSLMQTAGEIVGGTLESIGTLPMFIPRLLGIKEFDTRNFLEEIGVSINEGIRESFPIYMTEQAQKGTLLDRMKGGGFWASMTPSVLGSAVSIMLPARGASLLLGKLFRTAVKAGSKTKYVKDIFNLSKNLDKSLNTADKIANIYGSAIVSRVLDSSREAYNTYEQEREWFLNNYNNYIERDKNGNAILKVPGLEEVPLTDENINNIADKYADNAASKGYWNSMLNIGYDVVEWLNILGTAKTLTKATRDNIRKAMATGDKFSIVRALNAIPNEDRSQILRSIGSFAGASLSEMADEMTMNIAMKEGTYESRKDFGLLSDLDNLSSFQQRFSQYLKDPDIWTEGIGGLLGGSGMQIIMPYIETKLNKKGIEREAAYLKGIERSVEAMRSGLDGIVESLAEGDIIGAKIKEQEAILTQISANSLDGSLEFYKEMLRNMSNSLREIQILKNKRDSGKILTQEEQDVLDKGEPLLANANYFIQTLNKIEAVEPVYNRAFKSITDDRDRVQYERARRIANLEAQKILNNLELKAIENNSEEYQNKAVEAKEYLDNYIDSKYKTEQDRISKKANLNTYTKESLNLDQIKASINVYDELINDLKKKIATIEESIKNTSKSATKEQILSLKIALKTANNKLESYNKALDQLAKAQNISSNTIENLELTADDKNAINKSKILLSNSISPDEAKQFYINRNIAIDAELDYYNTDEAYNNINDEFELYDDEIKAAINEDLIKELDSYKTSEALKNDESKFLNSKEREVAYKARLARLQKQEEDAQAVINRRQATLNAELNKQNIQNQERDNLSSDADTNTAPIGTGTFGRPYKDFEGISGLSKDASYKYESLRSTSLVTGKSIEELVEDELKKNNQTEKDRIILYEIQQFNTNIERTLDNSFDTLTNTNLKWIVTRIASKYSIFDNIFFGRRFNWIDAVTKSQIEYVPGLYGNDITAELNHYLMHLNRYTEQVLEASGRPLPSFLAEVHFGLSETTKNDISNLINKILQEAKNLQTKFDLINNTIEDNIGRKNPKYNLFVSIGGIEYKVINTPNPRKDVGISLEGLDNQINRYVLTPAAMSTPNDDYILIAKLAHNSAPDQSISPTGDSKVNSSFENKIIDNVNNIINNNSNSIEPDIEPDIDTSTESNPNDNDTGEDIETLMQFTVIPDQPHIDFKINGVDMQSINEFLMSLMGQKEVNTELFDGDLLNALVLIPKLLKSTKGRTNYTKDSFIKNLITKFFTDQKLSKAESTIIETAKKVSSAISINIDNNNSFIKLNTAQNAKTAVEGLEMLKSLYNSELAWENDMQYINEALNTVAESDIVRKFAQILTSDNDIDSNTIAIRLDETLHNKFALISQDLGGIFVDNLNLFGTLVAFISDRSGFKINKINYYDLVDGMREYRGDNYKYLIPEIMSIMNITNYLYKEFENRKIYYNNKFRETKDNSYKELYNAYNFFYELIDVTPTNNLPLTEAQVINYINRTPEIKGKTYHEGLDIRFDPNGGPENILNNTVTNNLGIYEIVSDIKEGDEVSLVQTDLEENINKASYDIIIHRNNKDYKLGSIPKLETIINGIAYTVEGNNGQYYTRKFAFTDDMAKIFAEHQRELFRFMYYYDIAYNPRNNISERDRLNAERNIETIFDLFRKDRYKNLMSTLKELIYSNLTAKQIKSIKDSGTLYGIIDFEYENSKDGSVSLENVALSFNQIYQICLDLFPASRINNSNMNNIVNDDAIKRHFLESINRQEMIFKNNKAIRDDIRLTGSNIFRISHISAGKVLINDESHKEDYEAKQGLPLMHHRNSLIDSIKPTIDAIDSKGNPRVQILYIDENGIAKDPKTGGAIQNINKFATPHVADAFIGNRNSMVVVVPQTNEINTIFPIYPNTIMGSISGNTEDIRFNKLNKYIKYIGDAIKEILNLKEGNITQARLDISDRLQNIIICNERSSAIQDDIYFQSGNNDAGNKRYVMLKEILGDGKNKQAYHKFIQTTIDDRDAIIHYTSNNKLDVYNYNGALNHPSYPHTVYYLDNSSDVQKFNNKLNSIIPNLVRQFGLSNGLAISKDSSNSSYTTGYTDPITGNKYEDIYEYYMNTNARYSDVAFIKDKQGTVISNVSISGNSPIKFSIATKAFDTKDEVTQRFYDPVQLLKTVQDAKRYKEDWENIAKLANILEYEAGINPVYIKHTVSEEQLKKLGKEGDANVIKFSKDITGFYRNQFKIDIFYNWQHANKENHQGYLTRTLAHEMIHTYILKFFNSTMRDVNNPELLAKREALIYYNNNEWLKWFNDFTQAIANKRKELANKTELNSKEQELANLLKDNGIVNKFIDIISREFDSTSNSIKNKIKAREHGAKVVINGHDAVSEIITYALTDPRIFKLLNELKSTTERIEESENLETPTFWQKFKDVLLNIFRKIFGVIDTKINSDSLMERLNDTINRIYNKDFRDIDPDTISYDIEMNLATPNREGDSEGSDIYAESSYESNDESEFNNESDTVSNQTEVINDVNKEALNENESFNDDDFNDFMSQFKTDDSTNIKAATILSEDLLQDRLGNNNNISIYQEIENYDNIDIMRTESTIKYLYNSIADLNKNINLDETNKRIC